MKIGRHDPHIVLCYLYGTAGLDDAGAAVSVGWAAPGAGLRQLLRLGRLGHGNRWIGSHGATLPSPVSAYREGLDQLLAWYPAACISLAKKRRVEPALAAVADTAAALEIRAGAGRANCP